MKKIVLLVLIIFVVLIGVLSIFVFNIFDKKADNKELIINTKNNVEDLSSKIFKNNSKIDSEYFEASFLSLGHDMLTNLEEQYNKGIKVFIKYDENEVNGMVTGQDKNDSRKYHIYIGSKTYESLWTYATIDLDTGEISWKDNF